ncbi:hypothetical protein [Planococcus maritimus]|uniref:hypothetical protein n=1 Tax=Planococcus maritimus TaxID=192421 RepID=UPI001ABFCB27|nr:hypothetical protein [Planococcus maritimus]
MTYAVIGGGNTGQAIAGCLTLNEEQVKLYVRGDKRGRGFHVRVCMWPAFILDTFN